MVRRVTVILLLLRHHRQIYISAWQEEQSKMNVARMWKDVVMANSKILARHMLRMTEENH